MAEQQKIKAFDVFYPMENEFEIVKGILMQYLCMEYALGRVPNVPSDSLITALVFYLLNGYNYETKEKIRKYCKYPKLQSVDQVNLKLKQAGYLIDSPMSKKNKRLNDSLQGLSDYIHNNKGDKYVIRSIIYQHVGV